MINRFRVWLAKKILPVKWYMVVYTLPPDGYSADTEINITGPAQPGK